MRSNSTSSQRPSGGLRPSAFAASHDAAAAPGSGAAAAGASAITFVTDTGAVSNDHRASVGNAAEGKRGTVTSGGGGGGGTKVKTRSASVAAALQDPGSLLRTAPPACPPSLANRVAPDAELFQFYALRGHAEVLTADIQVTEERKRAVAAALGELSDEQRQEIKDTYEGHTPVDVGATASAMVHATTSTGDGVSTASEAEHHHPEKYPVAPAPPTDMAQPTFPRLRPSAEDDRHAVVMKVRQEVARNAELRTRHARTALPPVEAHYNSLYRPTSTLTAEMERGMCEAASAALDQARAAAGASSAAAAAAVAAPFSHGPPVHGSPPLGRQAQPPQPVSLSASGAIGHGNTSNAAFVNSGTSNSFPLSAGARAAAPLGVVQAVPAVSVGVGSVAQRAALLRESRALVAAEVDDVFVAAYYEAHPDALEKKQAEEEAAARRRSTRMASEAMDANAASARRGTRRSTSTSKKKRASKASKLPVKRDGAPPENLRYIKSSLLAVCDEHGQVAAGAVEQVLRDVPFEVSNLDALRDLLRIIRDVTEVRQQETEALATAGFGPTYAGGGAGAAPAAGNVAMENSMSGASRRGGGTRGGAGMSSTYSQSQQDGSGRLQGSGVMGPNSGSGVPRRQTTSAAPSVSRASIAAPAHPSSPTFTPVTSVSGIPRTGGGAGYDAHTYPHPLQQQHHQHVQLLHQTSAFPAGGGADPFAACSGPRVLVREVLGALHALVNGRRTRDIVRWICFDTLAAEGQGYIHKSTLQALRTRRREECEGPQADFSASIVKALDDAFACIAAEEEAAYINARQKGKRKGKSKQAGTVKLAPNQKSVIPMGVMRRSHMDFGEFCRFFDALPQLCAAFTRVWLGLLLNGRVGATAGDTESVVPVPPTHRQPRVSISGGIGGGNMEEPAGQLLSTASATGSLRRARVSISSQGLAATTAASAAAADDEADRIRPVTPVTNVTAGPGTPALPRESSSASVATTAAAAAAAATEAMTTAAAKWMNSTLPTTMTASAPVPEIKPGTHPLTLLGPTPAARRAVVLQLVQHELAAMRGAAENLRLSSPPTDGVL